MTDPRDQEIAELQRRHVAELEARDALLAALRAELAAARAEIAALKEQLGKSSKNSSKPPSSDGPKARAERQKKTPTGRKPGGQPGHEGHSRERVPPEKVTRRFVCKPERCGRCETPLRGSDDEPLRHQVFHLPKVEPVVDEYELHALVCSDPRCAHVTRASLPAGVPRRAFGPSVDAAVATLLTVYRLSRRMVPDFLHDFFGLTMADGSVIKCQHAVSQAVAGPVEQAHAAAKAAGVKYVDETGWREARGKAFLWTVVTSAVTVFVIQARRTAEAAQKALGAVHGVIGTDRHGAYNLWPDILRQFCWAHLTRAFVAMAERGGASKAVGEALLAEKDQMFVWWHRVRDGTLSRASFRRYMKPLQDRFRLLLASGVRTCANTKTGRTCQKVLDHVDALWTFVYREGIEPTNNVAERALRHAVILRKLCYGSHSRQGSRFTERMLTCHATLHQQGRSVLDFLTEAGTAALCGTEPPSLLPAATAEHRAAA